MDDGAGHLRASRADREQVIDELKVAFVQERLTQDELDDRVGRALVAPTYADLSALTADLPVKRSSPSAVAQPQPIRLWDYTGVKVGAGGVGVVTLVTSVVAGVFGGPGVAIALVIGFTIIAAIAAGFAALLIAAAVKLDARQQRRRLPPTSGAASHPTRRPAKPKPRRPDGGLALAART